MKQRKVPLRKCTGCQEMKNKKELIRIVRNDAGEFALDRTGKLPDAVHISVPMRNVWRRRRNPRGWSAPLRWLCRRKCMSSCFKNWRNRPMNKFFSLLGLCKRAGKLVAGEVAAEQAVRKKQAFLLILAQDASKNTKKKFTNSAVYYELPLAEIGTKEELGRAIGAEMRSIIAITEKGFAKKLKELADDNIENRTKVGEG